MYSVEYIIHSIYGEVLFFFIIYSKKCTRQRKKFPGTKLLWQWYVYMNVIKISKFWCVPKFVYAYSKYDGPFHPPSVIESYVFRDSRFGIRGKWCVCILIFHLVCICGLCIQSVEIDGFCAPFGIRFLCNLIGGRQQKIKPQSILKLFKECINMNEILLLCLPCISV